MVLVEKGDIAELIETGQFDEGVELEAKRASGQVPRAAWDSISAFANTIGGALVLGLVEDGDGWAAEGVSDPARMIQNLHNLMRDRSKISHDMVGHDDIWIESINGRRLVVVRIRPAPRRNKPVFINGDRDKAYVRRNEGDALCTDFELDRMRREATPVPYDSQILSGFTLDDLDTETIARYRAMSKVARPQLGHHRLDDKEFLRASRAWGRDRDTGNEGPTVAGLLMFGKDLAIGEFRPSHVIDYRRIPRNASSKLRWTDRLRFTGNLFSAWDAIFPRLLRSLPVPWQSRGSLRRDEPAGQDAMREALVNLLVHTDYREVGDATILDRDDGYEFVNPGISWVRVDDLGIETQPERRNPCIASLFQNVGLAEQAGSGYVTIREEWNELGRRPPVVVSDPDTYRFKLTLSLAGLIPDEDRAWLDALAESWTAPEELALLFARHTGAVDNSTLRQASGQHLFDASQTLRSLRNRGLLVLHGAGRNSLYELGPAADIERPNTDHLPPNTDHLDVGSDHLRPNTDHLDAGSDHLPAGEAASWIEGEILRIASPIARSGKAQPEDVESAIVGLCSLMPMSTSDLVKILDRNIVTIRRYVRVLVESGEIEPIHAQSRHPNQKYQATLKPLDAAQQTKLPLI